MKFLHRILNLFYRLFIYPQYRKYTDFQVRRGRLPFYYKRYIKTISRNVNSKPYDLNFLFMSDLHWGANYKLSPLIVKELIRNIRLKGVFSGGDVITESDSNKTAMMILWGNFNQSFLFLGKKFYQICGNHDNNSYKQIQPQSIFTKQEVNEFLSIGDGVRFGEGYSYYVDDICSLTRFLCLDTGKQYMTPGDYENLMGILKNIPPHWHIIVLTHLVLEWIDMRYQTRDYVSRLLQTFDNHNKIGKSKVELIIAGHVHNDYKTATDCGIPIVTVGSDAYGVACGKLKKSISPFHEQCMTVFSLNYASGKVRGFRIGRGNDITIDLNHNSSNSNMYY